MAFQGEHHLAFCVDGTYPSELDRYPEVIHIDQYDSDRQKTGDRTLRYTKKRLEAEFPEGEIPPVVEDLLHIAAATFAADLLVKRDVYLNPKQSGREERLESRKIELTVPVSDPGRWELVQNVMNEAVSFMTYDVFRYNFITRRSEDVETGSRGTEYDSVALFSGGLDSFGGSYHLRDVGYAPRFVSLNHSSIGRVLANVSDDLAEEQPLQINFDKTGFDQTENTQFSRSFMYLSFATAVAYAHGVSNVFIPENGIIARQIGLQDGRLTTRTAHPKFLTQYDQIVNTIFPEREFNIQNPFTDKTKTEVVNQVDDLEKLVNTVSCAHPRFLPEKYADEAETQPMHCGMGVPCLIRTISLVTSDHPDPEQILNVVYNPFLTNLNDIGFEQNWPEVNELETHQSAQLKNHYRDGLVSMMDVIKLALEVTELPRDEVVTAYPELRDDMVYKLYQRFSTEVLETVDFFKTKNSSLGQAVRKLNPSTE